MDGARFVHHAGKSRAFKRASPLLAPASAASVLAAGVPRTLQCKTSYKGGSSPRRVLLTESEHQPSLTPTASPSSFDPSKYRCYLEDTGLTEEQQDEYLRLLWSIMITFVDLGFGVDSVQLATGEADERAKTSGNLE